MRMLVAMTDKVDLQSASFAVPLSSYETYNIINTTTIELEDISDSSSSAGSVGIMMLQYNNNPAGISVNATSVKIETTRYAASRRRQRRVLLNLADNQRDVNLQQLQKKDEVGMSMLEMSEQERYLPLTSSRRSNNEGETDMLTSRIDSHNSSMLRYVSSVTLNRNHRRMKMTDGHTDEGIYHALHTSLFDHDETSYLRSIYTDSDKHNVFSTMHKLDRGRILTVSDYSDLILTVNLSNVESISYIDAEEQTTTEHCSVDTDTAIAVARGELEPTPQYITNKCNNGYTYTIECPGVRGDFTNECPTLSKFPVCTTWTGSAFRPESTCSVTYYTEWMTTCVCTDEVSNSSRRLLDGDAMLLSSLSLGSQSHTDNNTSIVHLSHLVAHDDKANTLPALPIMQHYLHAKTREVELLIHTEGEKAYAQRKRNERQRKLKTRVFESEEHGDSNVGRKLQTDALDIELSSAYTIESTLFVDVFVPSPALVLVEFNSVIFGTLSTLIIVWAIGTVVWMIFDYYAALYYHKMKNRKIIPKPKSELLQGGAIGAIEDDETIKGDENSLLDQLVQSPTKKKAGDDDASVGSEANVVNKILDEDGFEILPDKDAMYLRYRTIVGFFEKIIPAEVAPGRWFDLFWMRLLEEHSWFALLAPYNPERDPRVIRWAISFCNLLSFLFVTTILTVMFFQDDGTCEVIPDSDTCNSRSSYLGLRTLCNFQDSNEYCMFATPLSDFITILLYTLVATTIAVPIRKSTEYMITTLYRKPKVSVATKKKSKDGKQGAKVVPSSEITATKQQSDVVHDMDDMRMDEYITEEEREENMLEHLRRDEFKEAQTKRSTLMRAARLDKAQKSMDFVLPAEETALIMLQADADTQRFKNHMIFKNRVDNFSFRQMRYGFWEKATTKEVRQRVDRAREMADYLKIELELLHTDEEREILLMKHFFVDYFEGYVRALVHRYMLGNGQFESIRYAYFRGLRKTLFTFLLPLLVLLQLYLTYVYQLTIGSRSTTLWLGITLVAFIQDILILQPFKVFLRWIFINNIIAKNVRETIEMVRNRARVVLCRPYGLLRDSNALIQHFNPACRTARMFPELPISRLLFTLSDFDVPSKKKPALLARIWENIIYMVLLIVLLPVTIQDTVMEMLISAGLNAFFYLMAQQWYISLIVVIVLAGFLYLREYYFTFILRRERERKRRAENENMFYEIAQETYADMQAFDDAKEKLRREKARAEQAELDGELDDEMSGHERMRDGAAYLGDEEDYDATGKLKPSKKSFALKASSQIASNKVVPYNGEEESDDGIRSDVDPQNSTMPRKKAPRPPPGAVPQGALQVIGEGDDTSIHSQLSGEEAEGEKVKALGRDMEVAKPMWGGPAIRAMEGLGDEFIGSVSYETNRPIMPIHGPPIAASNKRIFGPEMTAPKIDMDEDYEKNKDRITGAPLNQRDYGQGSPSLLDAIRNSPNLFSGPMESARQSVNDEEDDNVSFTDRHGQALGKPKKRESNSKRNEGEGEGDKYKGQSSRSRKRTIERHRRLRDASRRERGDKQGSPTRMDGPGHGGNTNQEEEDNMALGGEGEGGSFEKLYLDENERENFLLELEEKEQRAREKAAGGEDGEGEITGPDGYTGDPREGSNRRDRRRQRRERRDNERRERRKEKDRSRSRRRSDTESERDDDVVRVREDRGSMRRRRGRGGEDAAGPGSQSNQAAATEITRTDASVRLMQINTNTALPPVDFLAGITDDSQRPQANMKGGQYPTMS